MAHLTGEGSSPDVAASLATAFAEEWSHVVATLIRVTGDWSLAEDCAQEAFLAATTRWERDGVPDRPGAWLRTVARNAAVDRLRRRATESRKLTVLAAGADGVDPGGQIENGDLDDESGVPDDRLRLIFTCCHPALPLEGRVALTLRTLCGLGVPEIARAFGSSEAAMAKRLVRARQKIAHARIPYRVPGAAELPERLSAVLAVVYLVFTEGYSATAGPSPVRADLCLEAIRLARLLARLVPGEAQVHALLALTLLHDARRPARVDEDGSLVPLEEQDRSRWDASLVAEGCSALEQAQRLATGDSPLLLQAEIAACHSTLTGSASPDWSLVVHLYDRLLALGPSPHAELSRAVALGMRDGPDAALALVRALAHSPLLDGTLAPVAAEADLLRRAGRTAEASGAYRRALDLVVTDGEAAFLRRRLDELDPRGR
ncbi:RNA polymerase sigma factor [Actinotalea sp.]|uniref:RNA polymerase sigma factor n=1 Tax=Actinotalea sp. TaxID=1872145 RepID=UPI003562C981